MFKYISKYKNIKLVALMLFIFAIPTFAFSQGLVPCGDTADNPCRFNDFIDLIRNVVNFLMFGVALPLSAALFSWAGILMLTSGGSTEKIKQAKDIFWWVSVGIVITFAAWLIVDLITGSLLTSEYRSYLN